MSTRMLVLALWASLVGKPSGGMAQEEGTISVHPLSGSSGLHSWRGLSQWGPRVSLRLEGPGARFIFNRAKARPELPPPSVYENREYVSENLSVNPSLRCNRLTYSNAVPQHRCSIHIHSFIFRNEGPTETFLRAKNPSILFLSHPDGYVKISLHIQGEAAKYLYFLMGSYHHEPHLRRTLDVQRRGTRTYCDRVPDSTNPRGYAYSCAFHFPVCEDTIPELRRQTYCL